MLRGWLFGVTGCGQVEQDHGVVAAGDVVAFLSSTSSSTTAAT
jgi:hypothetical protein